MYCPFEALYVRVVTGNEEGGRQLVSSDVLVLGPVEMTKLSSRKSLQTTS